MLLIIDLAPKGLVMGAIGDTPLNLKTPLSGVFRVLKKPDMDPWDTPEESHVHLGITLNKIANKKAFLGRVLDEYQIKKSSTK